MKIGILGGSFDPIHNGHLNMALKSYEQYALDEVWLIPNGNAPHKDSDKMADATDRLAMCELVAKEYPFLKTCDIEIISEEYSYTYITVTKLQDMYPEHEFYFIMGADSLFGFPNWRCPKEIAALCTLVTVIRDDVDEQKLLMQKTLVEKTLGANIIMVPFQKISISSSIIREKFSGGLCTADMLPEKVLEYVKKHGLYEVNNHE